jgi:hypothetical protein
LDRPDAVGHEGGSKPHVASNCQKFESQPGGTGRQALKLKLRDRPGCSGDALRPLTTKEEGIFRRGLRSPIYTNRISTFDERFVTVVFRWDVGDGRFCPAQSSLNDRVVSVGNLYDAHLHDERPPRLELAGRLDALSCGVAIDRDVAAWVWWALRLEE